MEPYSTTKPATRSASTTGFSLMFLLPVSSCSFLAIRNCCSCSSLTAERSVATCVCGRRGGEGGEEKKHQAHAAAGLPFALRRGGRGDERGRGVAQRSPSQPAGRCRACCPTGATHCIMPCATHPLAHRQPCYRSPLPAHLRVGERAVALLKALADVLQRLNAVLVNQQVQEVDGVLHSRGGVGARGHAGQKRSAAAAHH